MFTLATRRLVHGPLLACLLLSLIACQAQGPVKTKIVEVPVEVTVPIDKALTDKAPKPTRPPNACKDAGGKATICNEAMPDWLNAYDAVVDKLWAKLDAIRGLQPKPKGK